MAPAGEGDGTVGLLRRLLIEPARPARIRQNPNARWLAVGAVCIGAFMGQLDASIVTVALPSIGRDLHAGLDSVEWVALAYLVSLVATVVAVGRLADTVGRKLLYLYGFLVFIAASAACAAAPTLAVLIAGRVVQGLGAAMLQANSVALIAEALPAGELAAGLGVQGSAQAMGLALGPIAGGLLIALGGWRLVFLATVPAGLVGAGLAWLLLPRSRHRVDDPFDPLGAMLLAATLVAAVLALSLPARADAGAPVLAALAVGAVVLGGWLARHLRRRPSPLIDPSLLRSGRFALGAAATLLAHAVLFGVLLAVPYRLEEGEGRSAALTGLELSLLPAVIILIAPVAGRMARRVGTRRLTAGGMVIATAGALVMALAGPTAAAGIPAALLLVGAGQGLFSPANNAAVMSAAPADHAGVAAGILNMTRGLGTAVGIGGVAVAVAATGGRAHAGSVDALRASGLLLAALACLAVAASLLRPGASRTAPAQ